MISIKNISTVARYERKILSRSWFFRIFAIIATFAIGLFSSQMLFLNSSFTWDLRALPSNVIYSAFIMLAIAQSVIAVFLASDFLKRDKKLDTAEVLFIRPMSNSDYVIGKTLGIVSLFFFLNVVVMLLVVILTLSSDNVTLALGPYLWYFLTISVPSLVFVLGLSFLLMSVVRNQAITFLILLAYIGSVMFFIADKQYFVFDFLAYKQPLIFSGITGFSQLDQILLQRLSYLFLGLSFVFASVVLLKRLTQYKYTKLIASALTLAFFVSGIYCSFSYYSHYKQLDNKHEHMALLSQEYFDKPTVNVTQCDLYVEHSDDLSAKADMQVVNNSGEVLKQLVFSLNPALKVTQLKLNGETTPFTRDAYVLIIKPNKAMQVGETAELSMSYSGGIDFSVSYLDALLENKNKANRSILLNANQEFGFYSADYALLTIENLWYPISGIRYDATKASVFRQEFTHFSLHVKTATHLLPFSQGQREKSGEGSYTFTNEQPLAQLSLAIGDYVQKQTLVDSLELNLVHFKGHDIYSKHFTEIGDTLSIVLADIIDAFERPKAMSYPFQSFSIVEVPVQFKSLEHSWTAAMANSQPQMVLFPENGYGFRQADFKSMKRGEQRRNNNRGDVSEKEQESNMLRRFVNDAFFEENSSFRFDQIDKGLQTNPYNIFPNYYNYINYINSEQCPVLNYAFESYLFQGETDPRQLFMSSMNGLSDADKANQLLNGKSLKQIIRSEEDKTLVNKVLKSKGEYLLTWIQAQDSESDLSEFLNVYLNENRYKEINHEDFAQALSANFGIQLDEFIDDWYNDAEIPAYLNESIEYFKTVDHNQQVYIARTKITNFGKKGGIVKYSAMFGGGRGAQMNSTEYSYYIPAGLTKEIQMVFDEQPRMVALDYSIAKNTPSTLIYRGGRDTKVTTVKNMKVESYDKIVQKPVELYLNGEHVVDNTDPGFSVVNAETKNIVTKLFEVEDEPEFVGLMEGSRSTTWRKTVNLDFYGAFEKSAMIVAAGDGNKKAIWTTTLGNKGYYDVYVYLYAPRRRGPRNGGGQNSQNNGSYVFSVYHDDGIDDVELPSSDVQTGWNLLGSFYYSGDSARVEMNNKSNQSRVIADAVKWAAEGLIEKPKKREEQEEREPGGRGPGGNNGNGRGQRP